MNPLLLKNASALEAVPLGYVWESSTKRASFWRTIAFAFASGDWNKVHVNPFTLLFFKSSLSGMTYPGSLVTGTAIAFVHSMIHFTESTEVISVEDTFRYKRPLRVWSKFKCRYTLLDRKIMKGIAVCVWKIEMLNGEGKLLGSGNWTMEFKPVAISIFGKIAPSSVL